MPKFSRTDLRVAALGLLAFASVAAAADRPDDTAAFERLKSLAGEWAGRMEDPLSGPPVAVRYEVVSGGRAVIEHQQPSQALDAVTVYFLADGELRASQYSPAGNQPRYRLGGDSTESLLQLEFDGGTGFDADRDGHVHKGEIRIIAADRIEHRWFHYVGPKEQGVTHWFLERQAAEGGAVQAPPADPPAPAEK